MHETQFILGVLSNEAQEAPSTLSMHFNFHVIFGEKIKSVFFHFSVTFIVAFTPTERETNTNSVKLSVKVQINKAYILFILSFMCLISLCVHSSYYNVNFSVIQPIIFFYMTKIILTYIFYLNII